MKTKTIREAMLEAEFNDWMNEARQDARRHAMRQELCWWVLPYLLVANVLLWGSWWYGI